MATSEESTSEYWGYLIKQDKTPTALFEQLLLAIAHYIVEHFPPWDVQQLTPPKLAAFYRLVGGNYDPVFVDTPHATLSFIYKSLGCFHSLLPDKDPFQGPTIPALTPDGFVRWQTVELLFEPELHVPFLQEAVKRFDLVNRGDGGPFPRTLPAESLPKSPDREMLLWHESVSKRLRHAPEPPSFSNASSDISSLTTSSRDTSSITEAADYIDPSRRAYNGAHVVPVSPTTRRAPDGSRMSKTQSHSPHHSSRSPLHTTQSYSQTSRSSHTASRSPHTTSQSPHMRRRSSLPDTDPRDVDVRRSRTQYPRTPGTGHAPRPAFRSGSSTTSTESESSTSERSRSPQSRVRQTAGYHNAPVLDSTGRRHSAHAKTHHHTGRERGRDVTDLPVSRSGSSNTLSPPFFAASSHTHGVPLYETQTHPPHTVPPPSGGVKTQEVRSPPQANFHSRPQHARRGSHEPRDGRVRFRNMDEAFQGWSGLGESGQGQRFVGGEGEHAFQKERWRRRSLEAIGEKGGRR